MGNITAPLVNSPRLYILVSVGINWIRGERGDVRLEIRKRHEMNSWGILKCRIAVLSEYAHGLKVRRKLNDRRE